MPITEATSTVARKIRACASGGKELHEIIDEPTEVVIADACKVFGVDNCKSHSELFYAMADAIDAEYQKAIRELNELVGEMDELNEISALLPVDADGEVIHLGDRLENNERVVRIVLTDGSWEPSVYVEKAPCLLEEYFCNEVSHYHKPSVEDMLREFVSEFNRDDTELCDEEIIERFAAKLRLAEDEEEQ